MRAAADFLSALGRALSAQSLYVPQHPAREHATDVAYEKLARLQESVPRCVFTFLGDQVLFGDEPLRELESWDWSTRLGCHGVQRLELAGPATRDELLRFLDEVSARMAGTPSSTAEARTTRAGAIRYGAVGLARSPSLTPSMATAVPTARVTYNLREEAAAVRWMHEEVAEASRLPLLEAEAVVRSLSVAMHGDNHAVLPLLQLKEYDQYTTTHALNVSVLTMALAEAIGFGQREVRAFGVAGLLHDLGKVRIPEEILNKAGPLTPEERQVMQQHPVEGARIILEGDKPLDLAAVVAYEHHIMLDGGGYPCLHHERGCHHASHIVHVCDVYDALRTKRPYRDAWEPERVLAYIEERAGTEFEPGVARAFIGMMRDWERRLAVVPEMEESEAAVAAAVPEGAA